MLKGAVGFDSPVDVRSASGIAAAMRDPQCVRPALKAYFAAKDDAQAAALSEKLFEKPWGAPRNPATFIDYISAWTGAISGAADLNALITAISKGTKLTGLGNDPIKEPTHRLYGTYKEVRQAIAESLHALGLLDHEKVMELGVDTELTMVLLMINPHMVSTEWRTEHEILWERGLLMKREKRVEVRYPVRTARPLDVVFAEIKATYSLAEAAQEKAKSPD